MKGTSEHGARFFAETRYPARSLPSARFFMQVSTCMTANAGDKRCLQCSQASHSPAVPVEIGGLLRAKCSSGHASERSSWQEHELPSPGFIGCRRASQRPHEDVRRRTIPLRKQSVERRHMTRPQASCVGNDAPNEIVSAALSGEARTGSSGANGDAPSSGVLADSIRCKKHPE